MMYMLKIYGGWKELMMEGNMRAWVGNYYRCIEVPIFTCWGIWRSRNTTLFNDRLRHITNIVNNIVSPSKSSIINLELSLVQLFPFYKY